MTEGAIALGAGMPCSVTRPTEGILHAVLLNRSLLRVKKMPNSLTVLCVLACGLCWGVAQAQHGGGCEVAALVGQAQAGEQALQVGFALRAGMELRTGPDSRLRLRCADGSSLVMAANTQLRLELMNLQGGKRDELRWHLGLGLIGQKVSPGGRWTVRTPTAVTAVRGTEFTVEVADASQTAVLMQQGAVEVQPTGAERSLSSGGTPSVVALAAMEGTDCKEGRCSPAAPWGAARVQRTLDRLSGV